jgi:hypothetical protein
MDLLDEYLNEGYDDLAMELLPIINTLNFQQRSSVNTEVDFNDNRSVLQGVFARQVVSRYAYNEGANDDTDGGGGEDPKGGDSDDDTDDSDNDDTPTAGPTLDNPEDDDPLDIEEDEEEEDEEEDEGDDNPFGNDINTRSYDLNGDLRDTRSDYQRDTTINVDVDNLDLE